MSCRSALAIVFSIGLAGMARAQTIDGTATTLLVGHQDPRDGKIYTVVPVYETLSLKVDEFQTRYVQDLRLVVTAWGQMGFGDPFRDKGLSGDVDLGFIEGKLFKRRLEVRVGRQMIVGGVARMTQIDGGQLIARFRRGFGLSVYGGVPVTPRMAESRGDAVVGTRAFWQPTIDSEVAASFIQVNGKGLIDRRDIGLDARYRPHRTLTLSGYVNMSLVELRLGEADVAAIWQPLRNFELHADYRRTSPDLFIPRSSIFSVFAMETRDEAGGYLYYRPIPQLKLDGDYHAIIENGQVGHRGGGRMTVRVGPAFQTTTGLSLLP